jgi:hypothetical protein
MATEIRKIVIRKGTAAELQNLQDVAGGLDEGEFGWTTNEKKLYIGVGGTQHTEVLTESHAVRTDNPHQVTLEQVGGEPAFEKNGAFNKEFGTTEGTVAEGNHGHTFGQIINTPTTLDGYNISDADTSEQVNTKITEAIADLVNLAAIDLDTLGEIAPRLVTAETDIDALEADVNVHSGAINTLQQTAVSLSESIQTNIDDIAVAQDDITDLQNDKQDNLVKYNNYKTVNGVDIFDLTYNNTLPGDAYLRTTPNRTFLGSVSSDDLKTIITFNIANNYGPIAQSPYTAQITQTSVILYNQGAPNNNTAGQIGYVYWDISSGILYRCTTAAPSSNFYQWEVAESITAYQSYNVTTLNSNTVYRFNGGGYTSEWQIPVSGGANVETQGTLEIGQPASLTIYNFGLRGYTQLYIRYVYEDSVGDQLNYGQHQTVFTPDFGASSPDENSVNFVGLWTAYDEEGELRTYQVGDTVNYQGYYYTASEIHYSTQTPPNNPSRWNGPLNFSASPDVIPFKTPSGNTTILRAPQANGPTIEVVFGNNAETADVQTVYVYGLT